MKKNFALHAPGNDDQRVVEAIKNDVRKYVKRERRKPLPDGVDFWDFDCKIGADKTEPASKHVAEITDAIDAAAAGGAVEVYVEILSKPGHRTKKAIETPLSDIPVVETAELVEQPDPSAPAHSPESVD